MVCLVIKIFGLFFKMKTNILRRVKIQWKQVSSVKANVTVTSAFRQTAGQMGFLRKNCWTNTGRTGFGRLSYLQNVGWMGLWWQRQMLPRRSSTQTILFGQKYFSNRYKKLSSDDAIVTNLATYDAVPWMGAKKSTFFGNRPSPLPSTCPMNRNLIVSVLTNAGRTGSWWQSEWQRAISTGFRRNMCKALQHL